MLLLVQSRFICELNFKTTIHEGHEVHEERKRVEAVKSKRIKNTCCFRYLFPSCFFVSFVDNFFLIPSYRLRNCIAHFSAFHQKFILPTELFIFVHPTIRNS